MDGIKSEPEIDLWAVQTSANDNVDQKDPLSQQEDSMDLNVCDLKRESIASSTHFISDINVEENTTPITFSLVKNEPAEEPLNVIKVKEEVNLEETTGYNVPIIGISVSQNDGMTSGNAKNHSDDTLERIRTIEFSVDDTSAFGVATCKGSMENDIFIQSSGRTMNPTREYSPCGKSENHLEIKPEYVTFEPLKCNLCGKYLANLNSQKLHMLEHSNNESFKYDMCANSYKEKGCFKKCLQIHPSKKRIECHLCGKLLSTPSKLKIHIRRHSGYKPFKCDSCPKEFVCLADLNQHRLTHTGHKLFKCDACGKFYSLKNLKIHLLIHSGEKPFKCNACGKFFRQSGNLTVHLRTHTGDKPFKCHICGKSFVQSGTLKEHSRIHSGHKPYKCDVCGKSFSRSGNLTVHSLIHTGYKPFKCNVCGNLFNFSSNYRKHLRRHTDEKPK